MQKNYAGNLPMTTSAFLSPCDIRSEFARAMSDMYGREVPLYKEMVATVREINQAVMASNPALEQELGKLDRISEERHGAIRLGTPEEMATMAQLFAVMGMFPVEYYDLTVRDLPIHSTAYRPITKEALARNPFRVFCSVLRMDIVEKQDAALAEAARQALAKRDIFNPTIRQLMEVHRSQGGLTEAQGREFVQAAVEVFRWHEHAAVTRELYEQLLKRHDLLADVIGFKGPHINHLTPRVLDIDALHARMKEKGIAMIPTVQGPPALPALPLLRQTSFQALSEAILFPDAAHPGQYVSGNHRARFGEIEQRGVALTPKGRALYDELLTKVEESISQKDPAYPEALRKGFASFPQSYEALRTQGMAYFTYQATGKGAPAKTITDVETLLAQGYLQAIPITYEDFLPVSAAGIFKSNLVDGGQMAIERQQQSGREALSALVGGIRDPFALYEAEQEASLKAAFAELGLEVPAHFALAG
jgi:uncharacterized glyoxalase superfamily metalloenzyme YdcJ